MGNQTIKADDVIKFGDGIKSTKKINFKEDFDSSETNNQIYNNLKLSKNKKKHNTIINEKAKHKKLHKTEELPLEGGESLNSSLMSSFLLKNKLSKEDESSILSSKHSLLDNRLSDAKQNNSLKMALNSFKTGKDFTETPESRMFSEIKHKTRSKKTYNSRTYSKNKRMTKEIRKYNSKSEAKFSEFEKFKYCEKIKFINLKKRNSSVKNKDLSVKVLLKSRVAEYSRGRWFNQNGVKEDEEIEAQTDKEIKEIKGRYTPNLSHTGKTSKINKNKLEAKQKFKEFNNLLQPNIKKKRRRSLKNLKHSASFFKLLYAFRLNKNEHTDAGLNEKTFFKSKDFEDIQQSRPFSNEEFNISINEIQQQEKIHNTNPVLAENKIASVNLENQINEEEEDNLSSKKNFKIKTENNSCYSNFNTKNLTKQPQSNDNEELENSIENYLIDPTTIISKSSFYSNRKSSVDSSVLKKELNNFSLDKGSELIVKVKAMRRSRNSEKTLTKIRSFSKVETNKLKTICKNIGFEIERPISEHANQEGEDDDKNLDKNNSDNENEVEKEKETENESELDGKRKRFHKKQNKKIKSKNSHEEDDDERENKDEKDDDKANESDTTFNYLKSINEKEKSIKQGIELKNVSTTGTDAKESNNSEINKEKKVKKIPIQTPTHISKYKKNAPGNITTDIEYGQYTEGLESPNENESDVNFTTPKAPAISKHVLNKLYGSYLNKLGKVNKVENTTSNYYSSTDNNETDDFLNFEKNKQNLVSSNAKADVVDFFFQKESKRMNDLRRNYVNKLMNNKLWSTQKNTSSHNCIIIYDWDDTLFYTSFLGQNNVLLDLYVNNTPETSNSIFRQIEKIVYEILLISLEKGDVYIISNSSKGWVEFSCEKYFPSIFSLLEKVKVVSSRAVYEMKYPKDYKKWKIESFKDLLKFYNCNLLTNIISIGDSTYEIEAAHVLGSYFSEAFVKTIKFKSNPSPKEMFKQLTMLKSKFLDIYSLIKNLNMKVEKKEKD